jgi:DNA-binding response OmpR family regulator
MDPATRRVSRAGADIQLTGKEYAMLEYFMRNPGVVLSESRIIEHVWDMNHDSMTNTVNVYIHHLRNKIDRGQSRRLIHTIRGAGYLFSDREVE